MRTVLRNATDPAISKWLPFWKPRAPGELCLLCLPWAGGGASTYCSWSRFLPTSVELWAIQPPGRENRMIEPAVSDLKSLVAQLGEIVVPYLRPPFVLFGHSVGAIVCFEFARWLRQNALPGPSRLILSGAEAPPTRSHRNIHHLTDREFLESIAKYEGVPQEILRLPNILKMLLPTLRSDFRMFETYSYYPEPPLDCPISVFGGREDFAVSEAGLLAWKRETTGNFHINMFPGGHFFLTTARTQFLRELISQLINPVERPQAVPQV